MVIIGRITKDVETRATTSGKQVVNFSVAVNDSYKSKQGERIEQTTYFDCAYWRNTAIAQLLKKGTLVELLGRVSARAWMGKNGEAKAALDFHVSQIKFHSSVKKTSFAQAPINDIRNQPVTPDAVEDLPF